MTAPTISACIVCRNEADRLGGCLASVAWADEMVVLDLGSDDGSAELAERHGARVLRRTPVPIVELVRNEVGAAATSTWVLVLDPDERLQPAAADALRALAADERADAVVIPRTNLDLGHAPSHWTQRFEPQLRMYRRTAVRWPEAPNALPSVPADRVRRLADRDDLTILHHRSRTIGEVLDRSIRYAPAQARAMLDAGVDPTAAAMLRALWREVDSKLLEPRAWRDGLPGLLRAGILVGFKFHVWVEAWQQAGGRRTAADDRTVRRLGHALGAVRLTTRLARSTAGHLPRVPSRRRLPRSA